MKHKSILVISHLYPSPSSDVSGIFVHKMNLALKKLGCNLNVISPRVIGKKWGAERPGIDDIDVFYPKYFSFSRYFVWFSSWLAWKSTELKVKKDDYDLILAHTALPDGYIAKKLSKKFNIPYFVYVHGADVQHKIDYGKGANYLIKNILANSKKVFVNSSKTRKLVSSRLGIESVIVPMGAGELKVKSYKVKKGDKNRIRLISVCNMGEEKGIQYVIKALKSVEQKIEYIIIGDGSYVRALKRLARNNNRIKFLGQLQNNEVMSWLSESDIFVLPSYNEAFGVVYLEAMQAKLPIIGVKGEGVEDIVSYGTCGILVEPKDAESIVVALRRLINNQSLRESMGSEGQRIVNKYYLWDNVARDLLKELEL